MFKSVEPIQIPPVIPTDSIWSPLDDIERADWRIFLAEPTPFLAYWGLMVLAMEEDIQSEFQQSHVAKFIMSFGINSIDGCSLSRESTKFRQVPSDEVRTRDQNFHMGVLRESSNSPNHIRPRYLGFPSCAPLPSGVSLDTIAHARIVSWCDGINN